MNNNNNNTMTTIDPSLLSVKAQRAYFENLKSISIPVIVPNRTLRATALKSTPSETHTPLPPPPEPTQPVTEVSSTKQKARWADRCTNCDEDENVCECSDSDAEMPPVTQVMPRSNNSRRCRSNNSGMLPDKQRNDDRKHRGGGGTTNHRDRQADANKKFCPFRIFKPDAATCSCGKVHPDNSQQTLRHSKALQDSYERARQSYLENEQQLMTSRPDADRAVLIEALSALHMLFVVKRQELVDFCRIWNIAYRL